jgi:hypothetical protein
MSFETKECPICMDEFHGDKNKVVTECGLLHFIANFNKFCPDLSNIIHLPTITDLYEKTKFINTTDIKMNSI